MLLYRLPEAAAILLASLISAWAAIKASKAERNSRPVANGFTGYVLDDLRVIRATMEQHLIDHAARSAQASTQSD